MSTFIFLILIPFMIGGITTHLGHGLIDDPIVFFGVIIPTSLICVAIKGLLDEN